MKCSLVSTTSALALLIFGGGRVSAAPLAATSDTLLFGTTEQTDVVRDSLSLGGPVAPLIVGVTRVPSVVPDRPTIADPGAQTPSATFTYRPVVPVRGDTGFVGTTAANSRRNPGNVSNLRGTVASAETGIFSVPATEILINETPARAYNYIFRPSLTLGAFVAATDAGDTVPAESFQENPSSSVFIGVRSPVAEDDPDAATRRVATLSATGSVTPTVVFAQRRVPDSQRAVSAASLGYRADSGLASTIGFSTRDVRPTPLGFGAAASSTLGYRYEPVGRSPMASPRAGAAEPTGATISATITAPDGGPARRDWWDAGRGLGYNRDRQPAAVSSGSVGIVLPRATAPDVAVDMFSVAGGYAGGGVHAIELVAIPVQIKAALAEPGSGGRLLLSASEATEMDDDDSTMLRYGLAAAAVLLPVGAAFVGFRMIRRSALQRLG